MKPFRYRLESVLTVRAREESEAREAYDQVLQARARAKAATIQERATLEAYHTTLRTARECVSSRQHQLVYLNALKQQQNLCERCAAELAMVEKAVAERREAMLVARRRREALTRLREKQHAAWKAEFARAEEVMIGDMITARHGLGVQEAGA